MRIYAVADIHGKPERIALIRQKLAEYLPDMLIVAGDITHYTNCAAVIEKLNGLPVPVLAIRGNTDPPKVDRLLDRYPNTASLHLRQRSLNGSQLVGISGTIPVPFSSRLGFCEKKIIRTLATITSEKSVLVAHPPPRGTLDEAFGKLHVGCRSLHRLVLKCRPKLLLCGHIHERPGLASLGKTQVVNCCLTANSKGAIIELTAEQAPQIEML
jgi:Icc-related predicted phosphoesterase